MHNTNWNKKLSDPDSFNSSWDWTVSHSEYHFDTSVVEQHGDWYNVLGCFKGDWKADTDAIIKAAMPITWATRKYYKDNHDPSPMLTQEESDIRDVGVDPSKLMLTNMLEDLDSYPTLKKMCDHFGVTGNYKYRIHVQLTMCILAGKQEKHICLTGQTSHTQQQTQACTQDLYYK